jgi:hypothetical protein
MSRTVVTRATTPTLPVSLRVSALSLAASGILVAAALPWHPDILRHPLDEAVRDFPAWAALHTAGAVAAVLSLVGARGVVAVHDDRLGRLGRWALLACFLGSLATTALFAVEAIMFPVLASHAPQLLSLDGSLSDSWLLIGLAGLSVAWPVGLLLLGLAAARRHVFPVQAGALLAVTATAFLFLTIPFVPVAGPLAVVAFGAAQVFWGWLLWREAS